MHEKKQKAFTLVELIVVIVILSILSTIAFLSFNSQASLARDSSRLSDMNSITKGIGVFKSSSGKYPMPDKFVNITSSGIIIGYQGYVGDNVKRIINISGGKDPLNKSDFTYSINFQNDKLEILGFLENSDNAALSFMPFAQEAKADSYSGRSVFTRGDQLGVFLSSGSMEPIQDTSNGLELLTAGSNYIAIIDKGTYLNGTGSSLGGAVGYFTVKKAASVYPGCDSSDIKLPNGQIWAACNVGATRSYKGEEIRNCNRTSVVDCNSDLKQILGNYFQWGRSQSLQDSATGTISTGLPVQHDIFISSSTSWFSNPNDPVFQNLWGGAGTQNTTGTYISLGSPANMQGPCSAGYHVPTMYEWGIAAQSINPLLEITTPVTGGNWQNDISVATMLKLPLEGNRMNTDGTYGGGKNGYYWSSSANGYGAALMRINPTQIATIYTLAQAYAFSVRCLKN